WPGARNRWRRAPSPSRTLLARAVRDAIERGERDVECRLPALFALADLDLVHGHEVRRSFESIEESDQLAIGTGDVHPRLELGHALAAFDAVRAIAEAADLEAQLAGQRGDLGAHLGQRPLGPEAGVELIGVGAIRLHGVRPITEGGRGATVPLQLTPQHRGAHGRAPLP